MTFRTKLHNAKAETLIWGTLFSSMHFSLKCVAHDSHQQRENHALNFSQIKAMAVWLGLCSTLESCAADGHSGNGLCFGPAASQFGISPGFVILPQAAFLISTSSGGDKKANK